MRLDVKLSHVLLILLAVKSSITLAVEVIAFEPTLLATSRALPPNLYANAPAPAKAKALPSGDMLPSSAFSCSEVAIIPAPTVGTPKDGLIERALFSLIALSIIFFGR